MPQEGEVQTWNMGEEDFRKRGGKIKWQSKRPQGRGLPANLKDQEAGKLGVNSSG